jgi:hypothetical protein
LLSRARLYVSLRCRRRNRYQELLEAATSIWWNTVGGEFESWSLWAERMRQCAMPKTRAPPPWAPREPSPNTRAKSALDADPTNQYGAFSAPHCSSSSSLAHNRMGNFQLHSTLTPKPRSPKRTYSYRLASMKTLRFLVVNRAARLARIPGERSCDSPPTRQLKPTAVGSQMISLINITRIRRASYLCLLFCDISAQRTLQC